MQGFDRCPGAGNEVLMRLSTAFRSSLVLLFDLFAVVIAWIGAFLLRFNFDWPAYVEDSVAWGLVPLVLAQFIACHLAGLYRGMWTFASIPDLMRVLKAVVLSAAI